MVVLRELRRHAHFVLGPALGLALTGYFAYHLIEGDRGLLAWLRLTREIRDETANLQAVRAQREALDQRVSNLKPDHLDPDLLDERVRATLNLVGPGEAVIMQHEPPR
jgi:cell division protein FtsB